MPAEDASLQVMGSTIHCTLKHRHEVESNIYPSHALSFHDEEESFYLDITCEGEYMEQEEGTTELLCLLIGCTNEKTVKTWDTSKSGQYFIQFALVLQQLESGVYKQIGMSDHDSLKGWFKNARVENLEICMRYQQSAIYWASPVGHEKAVEELLLQGACRVRCT